MDTPTASDHSKKSHEPSSPAILIVLQWLSYSLWTWVLVVLSWLLSATLTYYFISKGDEYQILLYVFAAVVVLSPIAFVLDRLYAKREPQHKQGFAGVVLVLNAVLVFLAALGSVIAAVVALLSLAFRPESSTGSAIAIVSSGVVAVLAGMLFVRIIDNQRLKAFTRAFPFIMAGVVLLSLIMALAGPLKAEYGARNDRLIEEDLSSLSAQVRQYATSQGTLPQSLDQVEMPDYRKDLGALVSSGAVEYRVIRPYIASNTTPRSTAVQSGHYELCVTYQSERGTGITQRNDDYDTDLDVRNHPAGKVCYKQSTYRY